MPLEEDHPTPQNPEEGSKFDANHSSKQTSSLREVKLRLKQLWDFLEPFKRETITDGVTGRSFDFLALDSGAGESTATALWQIRNKADGVAEILVGTVSGMGLNAEPPVGKLEEVWYEFAAPVDQRVAVILPFEFVPESFLRNFNVSADIYALDHGGTVASYEMLLVDSPGNVPDAIAPVVNATTGAADVNGLYHLIVGFAGGGIPAMNNYLGPISINFCAPTTMSAVS